MDQWVNSSRAPGICTTSSGAIVGKVPSPLGMEVNSCHRAHLPLQMDQGILKYQRLVYRGLLNYQRHLYHGLLNCQWQMTTWLSCSLPYTDITVSYTKPTNAHLYYSQHFINTLLLQRVSTLKRPYSGSTTDTFDSHMNKMCNRCKIFTYYILFSLLWKMYQVVLPEDGPVRAETC